MMIAAIIGIVLQLVVFWTARRRWLRARDLYIRSMHVWKLTKAARDEIHLLVVENDRLRREGVWFDPDEQCWFGRTTVMTKGQTEPEAFVTLGVAVKMLAHHWPGTEPHTH